MPPAHALQDDLPLHELVGDGPLLNAIQHEVVARGGMPRRIADDALVEAPHLLGLDRTRNGKRQKPWRDHRYQVHFEQVDGLQPRIAAIDVMQNKVRFAIEQPFPRPGDCLEVKMQAGTRAFAKELPQKAKRGWQRTQIANHDPKLTLLPHRELRRVGVQTLQFSQQFLGSAVKRTPGFSECDAVAASVKEL